MSSRDFQSELYKCLKKYWGYSQFLEGQLEICLNILKRKDSFVIMATGSGKSLTFQLPAVCLRECGYRATTIVVSPLISLIDDQVNALLSMGIPACAIGSNSNVDIEQRALQGEFTIVYATPEKLLAWQHGLRELINSSHLACLAVDESHCVSEWGHDFRPEYRRLGELREIIGPKIPCVALTASATVSVQADIVRNLRLQHPLVAKASLNRANLKYCVINRTGPNDLLRLIHEYRKEQLIDHPPTVDKSTIPFYPTLIYVNSKKETEDLAKLLVDCRLLAGIKIAFYHAGMNSSDRSAVHMAFSKDEIQVVIATVAFGMGINKPDVRMVIHYGMTKSVESYYQQTGRAGRDGFPARCVLLFNRQDVVKCFSIASNNTTTSAVGSAISNGIAGCNNGDTAPGANTPYSSPTTFTQAGAISNASLHNISAFTSEQNAQHNATQRLSHQIHCMKEFSTTCGIYKCRRRFLLEYFGEDCSTLGNVDCTGGTSSNVTNIAIGKDALNNTVYACQMCCDLCDDAIRQHEFTVGADLSSIINTTSSIDGTANATTTITTMNSTTTSFHSTDISKEVYMLLRTIIDCGEMYGIGVPIQILLGKHDKKVQRIHNYSSLLYFGSGTLHTEGWWKELAHQLTDTDGFITTVLTRSANGFSYQRYTVSDSGRRFLRSDTSSNSNSAASGDNYFNVLMHGQHSANAAPNTTECYTEYDSSIHVYSTPLSRELRQLCTNEYNRKHSGAQSLSAQEAIQAARVGGTTMARSSSYPSSSTTSSNISYNNINTYSNPTTSSTNNLHESHPFQRTTTISKSTNKAIFDFVPQSMAFDPQKVASYIPMSLTDYAVANTNAIKATQDHYPHAGFAHGNLTNDNSCSIAHYEGQHAALLSSLRAQLNTTLLRTRNEIAQSSGLNPYNILITSDIQTLVHRAPMTIPELALLPGWGDWKVKSFGTQFVEAIKKFRLEHYHEYRQLEVFMQQIQELELRIKNNTSSGVNSGNQLYNQGSGLSSTYQPALVPEVLPIRPSVRLYRPNYDKNRSLETTTVDHSNQAIPNTSSTPHIINSTNNVNNGENLVPSCNITTGTPVHKDSQDSTGTHCSTETDGSGPAGAWTADSFASTINTNNTNNTLGSTQGMVHSQTTAHSSVSNNTQLSVHTACSDGSSNIPPTNYSLNKSIGSHLTHDTNGNTSDAGSCAIPTAVHSNINNVSAYAVAAAKKRQAMSGLAMFKPRKEVKLERARTDSSTGGV